MRLLARLLAIAAKRAAHAFDVTMRLAAMDPSSPVICDDRSIRRSVLRLMGYVFGGSCAPIAKQEPPCWDKETQIARANEATRRGFKAWQDSTKVNPLSRADGFKGVRRMLANIYTPLANKMKDAVLVLYDATRVL